MEKIYYVLFENHENGLKLHKILKENNLYAQISPTPRTLSKCCGISLIIKREDIDEVKTLVDESEVEILGIESVIKDINPNRDRYC